VAQVITVATEILGELPIGSFIVKLNHRVLLDAIFEVRALLLSSFFCANSLNR